MEQDHLGEVALLQAGVQGWVELAEGEWMVQGQAHGLRENAFVKNAERLLLMKSGGPVTL